MSGSDYYGEPPDDMDLPGERRRGGANRYQRGPQHQTQGRGSGGGRAPTRDGYVEVADRIRQFYEQHPDGRLVTLKAKITTADDGVSRVWVKAAAYRTPDDPLPGIGWSWMELPGKTPFTKGSELENTETSAWGRAIAALGIATKQGIATAEEVANKRDDPQPHGTNGEAPPEAGGPQPPPDSGAGRPVAPVGSGDKPGGAALAPAADGGLSYDLLVQKVREAFIPAAVVSMTAQNAFNLPAGASVRDLTDEQRADLWDTLLAGQESADESAPATATEPNTPTSQSATETAASPPSSKPATNSTRARGRSPASMSAPDPEQPA